MSIESQSRVEAQLREIRRNLDFVDRRFAASSLRRSLRKAANVMRDEARQTVSVDSGVLKKSIATETSVARDRRSVVAAVIIRKGARRVVGKSGDVEFRVPRRTVHLVEFGSRYHAASPFMRPAFDKAHGRAFDVFASEQRAALDRVIR